MDAFLPLYEPHAYIDRVSHYYSKMGKPRWQQYVPKVAFGKASLPSWTDVRALLIVIWRQGVIRDTRIRFWRALAKMARTNPDVMEQFLVTLATTSTSSSTRVVTREIQEQLAALPPEPPKAAVSDRALQPA